MQSEYNVTWDFCRTSMIPIGKKYGIDAVFALTKAEDVTDDVSVRTYQALEGIDKYVESDELLDYEISIKEIENNKNSEIRNHNFKKAVETSGCFSGHGSCFGFISVLAMQCTAYPLRIRLCIVVGLRSCR